MKKLSLRDDLRFRRLVEDTPPPMGNVTHDEDSIRWQFWFVAAVVFATGFIGGVVMFP